MKYATCWFTLVLIPILVFAALLTGCASVGRKVDPVKAEQIHRGSTRTEVRSLIGAPDRVSKNADGIETWTYTYVHSQVKGTTFIPLAGAFLGGTDTKDQSFIVTFNSAGEVTDYTSSSGSMEVTTDLQTGKARAK